MLFVAAVTLVAATACGDDGEPSAAPTSTTEAEPTSEPPSDEPSETKSAMPTESETTPAVTADVEVLVTITGGSVITAEDRVALEVGQTVRITVTGDTDDEIHVHGFEIEMPLVAGTPAEIEFEVGPTPGPGLYEVELHDSGLLLLQLEVR